jgi:chromosomal replication initiator protein
MSLVWTQCMSRLEGELPPQQFNTWIRPLQAVENGGQLKLLAPNKFVLDWVRQHFFSRIEEVLAAQNTSPPGVSLEIGTRPQESGASDCAPQKSSQQPESGFHFR